MSEQKNRAWRGHGSDKGGEFVLLWSTHVLACISQVIRPGMMANIHTVRGVK